uniref:PX domain-containing protein n=1 Tax=Steinernema glaseri TaxID=37863 RepID=A0A1I8AES4_9BILA
MGFRRVDVRDNLKTVEMDAVRCSMGDPCDACPKEFRNFRRLLLEEQCVMFNLLCKDEIIAQHGLHLSVFVFEKKIHPLEPFAFWRDERLRESSKRKQASEVRLSEDRSKKERREQQLFAKRRLEQSNGLITCDASPMDLFWMNCFMDVGPMLTAEKKTDSALLFII